MLADRYELARRIDRGGTASVWLGHDTVLNRDVALKQIGMAHGGGEPDLERAEREAHLAAQVNHRNVVVVFDLVDDAGFQWLVMENVDGPTLAGLIAQHGRLDRGELAPLVEQIAGALGAAHRCGIVHRDVQPSNILLTHDGVAKLSDFGVARALADSRLTQAGVLTGSPAYLPPEVVSGQTATAASDVWSLGATVFHALAGHPPYSVGEDVLRAMHSIVHDATPELDVGGPLQTLVAEMMQHDPHDRPTMAEVEQAVCTRSAVVLDGDETQGFAVYSAAVASPSPLVAEAALAPPDPPAGQPPAPAPSARPRSTWLAAAGVAALIAVTTSAFVRDDDRPVGGTLVMEATRMAPTTAPPTPTLRPPAAATTADPSQEPTTSAPSAPSEQALASASLEAFVIDYLSTASNDPDTGFEMLTPAFQQASAGLEGYQGFWGSVDNIDLERVSVDQRSLRVSYTYSYDFRGDHRTDSVTLQLVRSRNGFLIAGES